MKKRRVVVQEGCRTGSRYGAVPDMLIPRNIVNIKEYVGRFEQLNHLCPTVVVLGHRTEAPVAG